jgi:hypothetical protein
MNSGITESQVEKFALFWLNGLRNSARPRRRPMRARCLLSWTTAKGYFL